MQRSLSLSTYSVRCYFYMRNSQFLLWQALFTAVNWHEMQGILFLISQILTALSHCFLSHYLVGIRP